MIPSLRYFEEEWRHCMNTSRTQTLFPERCSGTTPDNLGGTKYYLYWNWVSLMENICSKPSSHLFNINLVILFQWWHSPWITFMALTQNLVVLFVGKSKLWGLHMCLLIPGHRSFTHLFIGSSQQRSNLYFQCSQASSCVWFKTIYKTRSHREQSCHTQTSELPASYWSHSATTGITFMVSYIENRRISYWVLSCSQKTSLCSERKVISVQDSNKVIHVSPSEN